MAGLFSGLLLAGVLTLLYQPRGRGVVIATPTPAPIRVYVFGAVARPGVYELAASDRVEQALRAAGGPLDTADLSRVNLAQRLRDEMQITVPTVAQRPSLPEASPSARDVAGKINVNLASASELETLPGIGPVLAQRIVQFREENGPYNGPEDLIKVRGISRTLVERLSDQITY